MVDDVADNRDLLELILVRAGYRVDAAATGEEAIESVARHPPDLVLLDLMLPCMNGHEVLTTLKGSPLTRAIPVIIVSAHFSRADRLLALEQGAEDMLTKPLRHVELCTRVRLALAARSLADPSLLDAATLTAMPPGDQPRLPPRFS